ncbi:MAG: hypothetical protein ACI4E1_02700 [Lachnospira sp.]
MNSKEFKLLKFVIFIFIVLVSLYVFVSCLYFSHYPYGYEKLYLLPASYLIGVLLFYSYFLRNEIVYVMPNILFLVLLFIRNVITPYVMITESFTSSLGSIDGNNINVSIWLITYETVVLFIFVFLCEKYMVKPILKKIDTGLTPSSQVFKLLMYGMIAIGISALIFVPSLRTHYVSFFKAGYSGVIQNDVTYRGNFVLRVLGTAGDIFVETSRFIFPVYVFFLLARKGQSLLRLIICLVIVLLQSMFMTDSNAYILMLMVCQLVVVSRFFPKYRKGLVTITVLFSLVFMTVLYFNRFALNHYSKSLSLFLQSYFPSVANTAGVLSMSPNHSFFQLFRDIVAVMPFKNALGFSGTINSTAQLWQETNNCRGQIVSTIGESYYYFGAMFSPILSCFFIWLSKKINKKIFETSNPIMFAVLVYMMAYAVLTPFLYNGCIYAKSLLQRVIFMLIAAWFCPLRISDLDSNDDIS